MLKHALASIVLLEATKIYTQLILGTKYNLYLSKIGLEKKSVSYLFPHYVVVLWLQKFAVSCFLMCSEGRQVVKDIPAGRTLVFSLSRSFFVNLLLVSL